MQINGKKVTRVLLNNKLLRINMTDWLHNPCLFTSKATVAEDFP